MAARGRSGSWPTRATRENGAEEGWLLRLPFAQAPLSGCAPTLVIFNAPHGCPRRQHRRGGARARNRALLRLNLCACGSRAIQPVALGHQSCGLTETNNPATPAWRPQRIAHCVWPPRQGRRSSSRRRFDVIKIDVQAMSATWWWDSTPFVVPRGRHRPILPLRSLPALDPETPIHASSRTGRQRRRAHPPVRVKRVVQARGVRVSSICCCDMRASHTGINRNRHPYLELRRRDTWKEVEALQADATSSCSLARERQRANALFCNFPPASPVMPAINQEAPARHRAVDRSMTHQRLPSRTGPRHLQAQVAMSTPLDVVFAPREDWAVDSLALEIIPRSPRPLARVIAAADQPSAAPVARTIGGAMGE